MSYTESDRANLKQALSSGELEVQYQDKKVRFRSITEIQKALAVVSAELDPDTQPVRQVRITSC